MLIQGKNKAASITGIHTTRIACKIHINRKNIFVDRNPLIYLSIGGKITNSGNKISETHSMPTKLGKKEKAQVPNNTSKLCPNISKNNPIYRHISKESTSIP
jgi:hypothetical protein